MLDMTNNNKVFLNKYGVVELVVVGDQSTDSVSKMVTQAKKLINQQHIEDKPVLILDNLLLIGEVPIQARKLVVAAGKTINYDRLAFLGKGTLMRLGSNLILHAIGKNDKVKYFENYSAAIDWLTKIK